MYIQFFQNFIWVLCIILLSSLRWLSWESIYFSGNYGGAPSKTTRPPKCIDEDKNGVCDIDEEKNDQIEEDYDESDEVKPDDYDESDEVKPDDYDESDEVKPDDYDESDEVKPDIDECLLSKCQNETLIPNYPTYPPQHLPSMVHTKYF